MEEEVTVERLIAEYGADNLEFVVEGNGEQQAISLGEVRELNIQFIFFQLNFLNFLNFCNFKVFSSLQKQMFYNILRTS